MAKRSLPSVEYLRQRLSYDPGTGDLTWNEIEGDAAFNSQWAGKPALNGISCYGYKTGAVAGTPLKAHRVAWAITYGIWTEHDIDHINGIRGDNRICNLREATKAQNAMNRSLARGKSQYKGVYSSGYGGWCANVQKDGRRHYLGTFSTEVEAANAYNAAAKANFGAYARLNAIS